VDGSLPFLLVNAKATVTKIAIVYPDLSVLTEEPQELLFLVVSVERMIKV
jgi:hypothetical protein